MDPPGIAMDPPGINSTEFESLVKPQALTTTNSLSSSPFRRLFFRSFLVILGMVILMIAREEFHIQTTGLIGESINGPDDSSAASIKELQIQNFRNGTALAVNIHVTHHAGTALCHMMRNFGPTPEFACMGEGKGPWPPGAPVGFSWDGHKETVEKVRTFRPYFFYMSYEHRLWGNLHGTEWEYENLVSIMPMRHPIDRFLAGGKCGGFQKTIPSDPNENNQEEYWKYANDPCADNYALRVLAKSKDCVQGARTSLVCMESAKALLRRFTVILDQECLSDSFVELGKALNLNIPYQAPKAKHPSAQERINNDTLYEFLQERFRRDIELYEWSKSLAIVKC